MQKTQRTSSAVTQHKLVRRFLMVLALASICSIGSIYLLSKSIENDFVESELRLAISSIISGPLEFARLHSSDVANRHLERLFADAELGQRGFVFASIRGGLDGGSVYAKWESGSQVEDYCLSSTAKTVEFADALYPFIITVTRDTCHQFNHMGMSWKIFLIGSFLFIVLTGGAAYLFAPVIRSTRNAIRILQGSLPENLEKYMTYEPVTEVLRTALTAKQLEAQAAIARMTQMVAHDVRKPFSTIQAAMTMFESSESFEEVQDLIPLAQRSIDQALTRVNGMLQDIIELGKEASLNQEPVSPKQLVRSALEEVIQIYQQSSVILSYDWNHHSSASVDPQKVQRVLSNIFGNAYQAMRGKGSMWVHTREVNQRIEFVLGNSGSYIPAENYEKLFDAFFTKEKKGGTGLGLAIAKKIVESHGGSIAVRSCKIKNTVEFIFDLPTSTKPDPMNDMTLSANLMDFLILRSTKKKVEPSEVQKRLMERLLEINAAKRSGREIIVGILDDEEVYRSAIMRLIKGTDLEGLVRFREFAVPQEAMLNASDLNFLITDVDLQDPDINGYDVVRAFHEANFPGVTCIHSNKALTYDYQRAFDVGATAFLIKPMTLDHLLRYMIDGLSLVENK